MKMLLAILTVLLMALPASGQEMRPWNPIRSKAAVVRQLPPGGKRVEPAQPLAAGTVARTTEALSKTWNSPDFQKFVSGRFYDQSRLSDAMNTETAKDARLKVMNSRNASILSQAVVPDPQGGTLRVSTLSVVLETRAEFNDPRHGFISAPGTNEMILEVVEKID
jgi:hypothetical protein